ncbi:hypothetical protein LRR81_07615 [Metabacillus sp. GX 13764]|uniref:hypothetical protein n=1 Tax=Metabacillus kandeliae TaxID=2900151 RepID=UPI001E637611|nr:hypothetical protein [Metabacillus kandeliae]MCD7034097.1 hypothetical protein [Metabacillus kandeliae]
MEIGRARQIAEEWVRSAAPGMAGFKGAYFAGSAVELKDGEELPEASDLDVMIVIESENLPPKVGKFYFKDVLLEASSLSWQEMHKADISYHLANSLKKDTIILDPSGELSALQQKVERNFARKAYIRARCRDVRERIENGVSSLNIEQPMYDAFTSWLFAAGVTTHMVLTAALENPTVRKRYAAAKRVLERFGLEERYPEFLDLLGCSGMSAERAEHHLAQLEVTFDLAAAKGKTPFFFSSEITPETKAIAIWGSREMIQKGEHREAVFWIGATFARCHKILAADAPEEGCARYPAFQKFMEDLGVFSYESLEQRGGEVLRFLPGLEELAEAVIEKTSEPQRILGL